jgi:hypothetical protein
MLVDGLAPPPPIVPQFLMVPSPLTFLLPLTEIMLGVAIAPLGATIPQVIET